MLYFFGLAEELDQTSPEKGFTLVQIPVDREKIAGFCRERHIERLSLFGSVLREDFDVDSDVDVLVEFEPGHIPGLGFLFS